MLRDNEILSGKYYAWDIGITEPDIGCNVFTITGQRGDLLEIDCVDGQTSFTAGSHCLIPEDRALARLYVLENYDLSKEENNSNRVWRYNRERKHLEAFRDALSKNIHTELKRGYRVAVSNI